MELGVGIAILRHNQILLVQREDFEVWTAPGGMVDAGESLAQAAIREAKEETGLDVRLTRLVGLYSIPAWAGGGSHNALFAAEPVGGELAPDPAEIISAGFFSPHHLPEPLMWWWRQRIADVFAGVGGSAVWTQGVAWPFAPNLRRQELYALRDASGLSRQEFWLRHMREPEHLDDHLDVGAPPARGK